MTRSRPSPKPSHEPIDPRLDALDHETTDLLSEEEQQAYDQANREWAFELGPVCRLEEALIRRAAIADVRLKRCEKAEVDALQTSLNEARLQFIKKKRHYVRRIAQSLPRDPAATVSALESTPYGCDWLLARWAELDARLAQGLAPTADQQPRVLHLAGYQSAPPGPDAEPGPQHLWAITLALFPERNVIGYPLHNQSTAAGFQPPDDAPRDPIAARAALRTFIADERTRLDQLRFDLLEIEEDPALASIGLIPTDPASRRRQRYEAEAERSLNRTIGLLLRLRRDRRKEEADALREARRQPRHSTPKIELPPSVHTYKESELGGTAAALSGRVFDGPAEQPQPTPSRVTPTAPESAHIAATLIPKSDLQQTTPAHTERTQGAQPPHSVPSGTNPKPSPSNHEPTPPDRTARLAC